MRPEAVQPPGPLRAACAALVLWFVLVLPHRPEDLSPEALLSLPPELPLLLALSVMLGRGRTGRILLVSITAALVSIVALKIADLATREVLGRSFNPVADLPLIEATRRILAGSFGTAATLILALALIALLSGLAVALWWALSVWARIAPRLRPAAILTLGAAAAGIFALSGPVGGSTGFAIRTTQTARQSLTDLRAFRAAAQRDPLKRRDGLLSAINRDVLVIFIESYGRTSFDSPFYADTHLPVLRKAEAQLRQAGLSMRSGFLNSPTQGGQSWLAHASFANGLWISDQSRYLAALASGRQTLFHHAQRAGFRTAAIMPAITLPWPEAQRMGFDDVFTAADLGYRGKPFNWVTMPDQFTLAAADRLLAEGDTDPRPVFAQIALISSHAPWVPIPSMIDWEKIGDGQIFNEMAEAGDPPRIVWQDRARVRQQYRKSIDYVLRVVTGYALRHADAPPLMIVLGDHQAAASIALDDGAVPVHLIGPEALVARSAAWGLAPGLVRRLTLIRCRWRRCAI